MFSLDRFYKIIHNNLVAPFHNGRSVYFYPFGTYQYRNVLIDRADCTYPPFGPEKNWKLDKEFFHCYFFDQEPIYAETESVVRNSVLNLKFAPVPTRINVLANSEISDVKNNIVSKHGFHDWYYFYHGFAALDWYRDFQYFEPQAFDRFDKVFICYNHLISNLRSYRLHLVSNLIKQDLVQHGQVSLSLQDPFGTWQDTVQNSNNPLDPRAKETITTALSQCLEPLTIDTNTPHGSLSADVNLEELTSALWHIVTETIYFDPKLHLTEKVFKPIVARRPFILVAAPGNLAYLKSYGFRTFDRWIDESYDSEPDHYVRIEKITEQIARLCAMEPADLIMMHAEMQETLDYNFDHFYNTFKDHIVDELVDNFKHILDLVDDPKCQLSLPYLEEVKKRLKQ